jgi:hypothetical protein
MVDESTGKPRHWKKIIVLLALLILTAAWVSRPRIRKTSQRVRLKLINFDGLTGGMGRPIAGATVTLQYEIDLGSRPHYFFWDRDTDRTIQQGDLLSSWGITDAEGNVGISIERVCSDQTWSSEPPEWCHETGKYYHVQVRRAPSNEDDFRMVLQPGNMMIVNPIQPRSTIPSYSITVESIEKPQYCDGDK